MFKLTSSIEAVSLVSEQKISTARVGRRGQLRREIVTNNQRHNFYTNRAVNAWNALPDDVIEAKTVNKFKKKLDKLRTELPQRV